MRILSMVLVGWVFCVCCSFCEENDFCFRYVLENECSVVFRLLELDNNESKIIYHNLIQEEKENYKNENDKNNENYYYYNGVSIEENEQEDYFNENVSLMVSNVRMVKENCRRVFLSYFCQLMFGVFFCQSSSFSSSSFDGGDGQQSCFEEQYCLQASQACEDDFQINCSSSFSSFPSPFPSPSPFIFNETICKEEVTIQIDQIKETPIPVQTCEDGEKQKIECCIDPFIYDEFDECVLECPQFIFGEKIELWVRNITFGLLSLSFLVLFFSVIPFYCTGSLRYPNNVLFLYYAFYHFSYSPFFWMTFSGGPKPFICGNETNYWKGLENYSNSTRSIVQYSLWIFLVFSSFSFWLLFTFNLVCNSARPFTTSFEKFITQPVKPLYKILFLSLCSLLSLSLFLLVLLYSLKNNALELFFPFPIYGIPVAVDPILDDVYVDSFLGFIFVGSLLFFIAFCLFVKRGRHIFYFQWRTFVIVGFWTIISFLFLLSTLLLSPPTDKDITNFADCVSSHPQTTSPPCQRQHTQPKFFLFVDLSVIFLLLVLLLVTFWTNDAVLVWWKDFLFCRPSSSSSSSSSPSRASKYERLEEDSSIQ